MKNKSILISLMIITIVFVLVSCSPAHNNAAKNPPSTSLSALTPVSGSAFDPLNPVQVSTIPLYTARLTRDGSEQTVTLDILSFEKDSIYVLNVVNEDNKVIWTTEAHWAHAGWNTILLTRVDGREYLMRYMPSIYQGGCAYSFSVFSLDSDGNEIILDTDSVNFGMNPPGSASSFHKRDIEPMKAFFAQVNHYLAASELLLSSDQTFFKNLPKEWRDQDYAYGAKQAPVTELQDYFYGRADLTFDEQIKAYIKNYTKEWGEPPED